MDEAELKHRTKQFALRCMKLADSLPKNRSGNIIAGQLIRCGTSVGANYRAACRGRSKAEFVSKIGIVQEEADESSFWMELIMEARLQRPPLVTPLYEESVSLTKIMTTSIKTAQRSIKNQQSKIKNT